MRMLILGATGMLGRALMREAARRNIDTIGAARKGTDLSFDLSDDHALIKVLTDIKPEIIVNTAAVVNVIHCEKDPGYAYLVNARSLGFLAKKSRELGAYLIQISTDHYFSGDRDKKHTELHPVLLVNEYARTKYAGEQFALTNPEALVVRTNIVGFRESCEHPALVDWVIDSLGSGAPMTLFEDYFTSSIDVRQLSSLLLDLLPKRPKGILNMACSQVFNKKTFIQTLAGKLGYSLANASLGSVFDILEVIRAESLGLDVSKAEGLLGRPFPTLDQVIDSLVKEN